MLSVTGLRAGYGASQVLFDVSLEVGAGQVVTLMGRNGMGKTTTIRTIMGLLRPMGGSVRIGGAEVGGLAPERIARLGVGLVPEGRQVFPTLSVRENLICTAANRLGADPPWTWERAIDLFPRLGERRDQLAGTLSGGEQQMLAVARALMTNPRLLILDEATEGLAPTIRREIWQVIERLKAVGQSILLIDKNLTVLKRLADRHFVIARGQTVWSGSSADLEQDEAAVRAHIGV